MKKIVNIVAIFLVLFLSIFTTEIYAAPISSIDVTTDKETVHPGETITLNIKFGEELGAYTVDVAYDNKILEYVSAEGGTANDNGTRVRVYFFDDTGGSNPRNTMSVTFRAKADLTTSNPTDLSVTAEGLANPDASVSYDDITVPIDKSIIAEPVYVDYSIALSYTGDIIVNEEKDMKLTISSTMGKNYEHTRIIGEATTPSGATAKLLAIDNQSLEHDIIQSGWGDASGDPIGGKDVVKELAVRGLFSEAGDYSITLKLIDRDNSDAEIASKTFQISVKEKATVTPPEENPSEENQTGNETTENNNGQNNNTNMNETQTKEEPETLPQTGNTIYLSVIGIISILIASYIILKKKD